MNDIPESSHRIKGLAFPKRGAGKIKGFDEHIRRSIEGQVIAKRKGVRRGVSSGIPKDSITRSTGSPSTSPSKPWDNSTALDGSLGKRQLQYTVAADVLDGMESGFQPKATTRYHGVSATGGVVRRGSPRALTEAASMSRLDEDAVVASMAHSLKDAVEETELGETSLTVNARRPRGKRRGGPPQGVGSRSRMAWFEQLRAEVAHAIAAADAPSPPPEHPGGGEPEGFDPRYSLAVEDGDGFHRDVQSPHESVDEHPEEDSAFFPASSHRPPLLHYAGADDDV
jgi:hypothetical protein